MGLENIEENIVWVYGIEDINIKKFMKLTEKEFPVVTDLHISEHLDRIGGIGFENGPVSSWAYFFSLRHKDNWLPPLKELILARIASFEEKSIPIIIDETSGSGTSHIIMKAFSKSKLIFLLEDGRDVVETKFSKSTIRESIKKILNKKDDRYGRIYDDSNRWKIFSEKTYVAYQNHDPNLRLLVKYEDLKGNTFEELKKIYEFIGIDISDDELDQTINKFDFSKIPSSGKWKENFTQEEQDLMSSIMGESLKKFGYNI